MMTQNKHLFERRGITMVESLTAVTITAVAGAALLTTIGSSIEASTDVTHAAIARGLAEQLLAEVVARRVPAPSQADTALTTRSPIVVTAGYAHNADGTVDEDAVRHNLETVDDFHDWSATPPLDEFGTVVGREGNKNRFWMPRRFGWMEPNRRLIARFTRQVEIQRVEPDGADGWRIVTAPTNHRRCIVRVNYTDAQSRTRTLAEVSQIVSHVSPP